MLQYAQKSASKTSIVRKDHFSHFYSLKNPEKESQTPKKY